MGSVQSWLIVLSTDCRELSRTFQVPMVGAQKYNIASLVAIRLAPVEIS